MRRRELFGINGLPYDSEIEYLKSNNTIRYIDTNFIPKIGDSITVNFMFTKHTFGADRFTIFSAGDDSKLSFTYVRDVGDGSRGVFYQYFTDVKSILKMTFTLNSWYELSINFDGTAIFDGKSLVSTPISELSKDSTIRLFADKVTPREFIGAIGKFSIKRDEDTVLDLISVRRKSDGYMYNKVSNKLFGTPGSGFILGPDIEGGGKFVLLHFNSHLIERRKVA